MKPIRILQVMAGMNRGGAETYVMNLYRNIDREKVQFDFILHTEKECAFNEEIRQLGGNIYSVPRYNGKNHLKYKQSWEHFFNDHNEHKIIHAHVRSTASIFLQIAKNHNRITISHSHNTSSGKGFEAFFKDVLQLPLRYTADYMFACSQMAGEWLFGKKITKKNNYKVWNNAIETEKYSWNIDTRIKVRAELKIPKDAFVIGHVGRFHEQKNHDFLIDIFKELKINRPNSFLLLVGEGALRDKIENKIDIYELRDSVILTGIRSDVPDILQAMDVFLFPSLHEGLPVTLIEAQAAGLPCVISNTITSEVAITKLIDFVALNENIKVWSNKVIEHSKMKREITYNQIVEAGYDIKSVAKDYERFCVEKWK